VSRQRGGEIGTLGEELQDGEHVARRNGGLQLLGQHAGVVGAGVRDVVSGYVLAADERLPFLPATTVNRCHAPVRNIQEAGTLR